MQGFEAKKKFLRAFSFPFLSTASLLRTSILRARNPNANRTRLRWLEGKGVNHYTTPIATMQSQNAVFKPNVEKKAIKGYA